MKTLFQFLLFLSLLYPDKANSQDYQLFQSNRIYLYDYQLSGQIHIAAFKSNAPTIAGTDSVFSNYRRCNDDLPYGPWANSGANFSDSSWAGCQVIVKPSGENILLNNHMDSLHFECLAQTGNNWTLYHFQNGDRFVAHVDSLGLDSVMGVPDSVKKISIVRTDSSGNQINDSLNNFTFRISKNFGLLTTVNIRHFPNSLVTYEIEGIDSLIGSRRISPSSIFNFDVGDIFHYYSFDHISASVLQWQQEKRAILSKSFITDSVVYTIQDSLYTQIDDASSITTTLTGSVITESYCTNFYAYDSLCSNLAEDITVTAGPFYMNYMTTWHRVVNNRRGIYSIPCLQTAGFPLTDYVLRNLAACNGSPASFPGGSNWFVEGLGLFNHYASMDSTSSVYIRSKELVYFQKGNETYGTPLSFPLINNITSPHSYSNSGIAFPNPANNDLTILNAKKYNQVILFNAIMKPVKIESNYVGEDLRINTNKISSGIYFLSLSNEEKADWMKVIIAH